MASDDACMFCGVAPCECAGKKKAKPKAPAKKKSMAAPAAKPANLPRPAQKVKPVKKMAAPVVDDKRVLTPVVAGVVHPQQDGDKELWQAISVLVSEDMLSESESRRMLAAYPRRPQ